MDLSYNQVYRTCADFLYRNYNRSWCYDFECILNQMRFEADEKTIGIKVAAKFQKALDKVNVKDKSKISELQALKIFINFLYEYKEDKNINTIITFADKLKDCKTNSLIYIEWMQSIDYVINDKDTLCIHFRQK